MTSKRKPTAEEIAQLRARLSGLSHEEKVQLATRTKPILEHRGKDTAAGAHKIPETDDELWEWIRDKTGFEIPRIAVCEDHDAPFEFLADAFFERESALFLLGSREMGKTLGVSILHFANSELRPGTESLTFGAIEPQARRAYKHLTSFVYETIYHDDGTVTRKLRPSIDGEPLRSETRWKNGSLTEIVVGSKSGVNSPHPQKVHADEVDLMDESVWDESRSMSSSKQLRNGKRIKAQDFATSTRKSMTGLVQKIINEVEEAERKGLEPSWRVYRSCIFENAKEMPNCQRAPQAEREARMKELGLDPCDVCTCDKAAKGDWGEDIPRTLDSVCRGRFFRSRGWMEHDDVRRKFRASPQSYWDAQMECRRPMADGLYLPGWTRERYSIVGWVPDPRFGNIWTATDWGGSDESAILWAQGPLRMPVRIMSASGLVVEISKTAYVIFDELLIANTGASKLADMVVSNEIVWKRKIPNFRVTARFCDMAGKMGRDDWREHNPPLRTVSYLPNRDFDPTVKNLQDLVEDKRYWVDTQCSRHMDDIESWRQKDGREVHDAASHSCASARYLFANTEALERRKNHRQPQANVKPVVVHRSQPHTGVAVSGGSPDSFAGERAWRSGLGENFSRTR